MIELIDTSPHVDVQLAEYKRLLGYPRRQRLTEPARKLAHWARAWYARNASPWVYARQSRQFELLDDSIVIDGQQFTSRRMHRMFALSQVHSAVLVAVGAGSEIERRAQVAWQDGRPDEYFFLEVFGSTVVEYLITMAGAGLCAWAEAEDMAVLPHDSPGYAEWDIAEQSRLLNLIKQTSTHELPGRLDVLDSGMLCPKKSMLAVFGLTHHTENVTRLTELTPCESCSYLPCQFRRKPYVRPGAQLKSMVEIRSANTHNGAGAIDGPLDLDAKYAVNSKALTRWANERLKLSADEDGSINAHFKYEGTTCTNLGRVLTFHYHVRLASRSDGYVILDGHCGPAPDDTGHACMCRYMNDARQLMDAIESEKPLLGRPLNDVLYWRPPAGTAGCYCESADRTHKWRLVFETIHFALVQNERRHAHALAQATPTT